MPATASHRPSSAHADEVDARRRARIGFALSHPTVVVGLALGADAGTGIVGAAILALHGLVELQWHLADRAEPTGIAYEALRTVTPVRHGSGGSAAEDRRHMGHLA